MVDQSSSLISELTQSLQQPGQPLQVKQSLIDGMGSYVADYLRPQTTAKLLVNLLQSRRQGIWTNRDCGTTKYVSTLFNSGAAINEFGQFIDTAGNQQLLLQAGSNLIWYNLFTGVSTNLSTSIPTTHSANGDAQYPLFPCIREFQTTVAGTTLYSILVHPQIPEPYTIDASGNFAVFPLNASAAAGYWGTLTTPIVSSTTVYGYPALCEPFLNRMCYAGWPISFQTGPPGGFTSPSIYDILITNSGKYDTVTQSTPLVATDGVRIQVPAICGRPTALKAIQLNNNTNAQALIVGCQNGVCLIQGTDANNFGIVILTREFGIPSNRALLQVQNDIVFLANDGIRAFSSLIINANLLTSAISYELQDYVQNWDQTWLNQAFAVRNRRTKDIQFWMPQLNQNGSSTGSISTSPAAAFNATSSQYLSHADNASLETGNIPYTWAAWVNLSTGSDQVIMSKRASGVNADYELLVNGGLYSFFVTNGTSIGLVSASTYGTVIPNQWVFIVAWLDAGAQTINIKINDGSVNSFSLAAFTPISSTGQFQLGAYTGLGGGFYTGLAKSWGFWKRILTASEITQLYNNGTPLLYSLLPPIFQSESTTTFISYWNLTEATGTRNDSRTTANNLTSNNSVGSTNSVSTYIPAINNLGMVFNYGDSTANTQAIPQLDFTPSIRQGINAAAAIEFQDPNNQSQWTMFGGGYNGYLYKHYSGNTNDGAALPFFATFPLASAGNDAKGFSIRKIHIVCEGSGQNFYANVGFLEMMASGQLIKQQAGQGLYNLISGTNQTTVLGTWILGQSAFPGTFPQLLEFEPTGEGRYAELQISGYSGVNYVDLIGSHFLLNIGSTRR